MKLDTIVIGAGQAGLSIGYYLKSRNQPFLLLEKGSEVGDVWINRYDSLQLFTPNEYNQLPGLEMKNEKVRYPTKDQMANYLKNYAKHFSLPIQFNTEVVEVHPLDEGFKVVTNQGEYEANHVVVATGPFQQPFIPPFANELSQDVLQLHSSQYKNPKQLAEGSVLVVGCGNSGAQIAVELVKDRDVYLSVGQKIRYLPQDFGGQSIFWWFKKLGILTADVESKLGQFIKKQPDPIFGFELKSLTKNGRIKVKPRTNSINNKAIQFEDGSKLRVNNVIWSTGFQSNYSWLKIPNLLNAQGDPIHRRGITNIKGLYFLGLPWQYRRGSALLQGVGYDAKYIVQHVVEHSV